MQSLILFAHGARDPEWAAPLARLREAVLARQPALDVRLAFLEFMQPGLGEAIDACVAQGATSVVVLPVFLAQGGHVKRELPDLVEAARRRHPGVSVLLRSAVGEAPEVIDAMAGVALNASQADAPQRT